MLETQQRASLPLSSAEASFVGEGEKTRGEEGENSVPRALWFRFSPGPARLLFTSPRSSPHFPARTKHERDLCGGESIFAESRAWFDEYN